MIEAGLRLIASVAHMPFADEGGFIARLLQVVGEEDRASGYGCVVVHYPMLKGVLSG